MERIDIRRHAFRLLATGNTPPVRAIDWHVEDIHMYYSYHDMQVIAYLEELHIQNIAQLMIRVASEYSFSYYMAQQIRRKLFELGFLEHDH